MTDCIFCKIVAGQIPADVVFEDRDCLSFLDIKPVNFGHLLVIPKEHFVSLVNTPDEEMQKIFVIAKRLMKVLQKSLQADFVSLSVVGVEVPHFHVHLVPRFFNDGLANWWPTKQYPAGEMAKFAENIRKNI